MLKKKSLFRCSAVECISRRLVCNGIENCNNGHDEYCGKFTLYNTCRDASLFDYI